MVVACMGTITHCLHKEGEVASRLSPLVRWFRSVGYLFDQYVEK